jgi:hypothetical protein
MPRELGPALVVGVAAPGEDHSLSLVVDQQSQLLLLQLGAPVRVAHDGQVSGLGAHVLDPACDLGEVGVDDVADDHPDDPAALGHQRASEGARRIAELLGGRQDLLPRLLGDRVARPVEDARRRRDRDSGLAGDLDQRPLRRFRLAGHACALV